MEHASTHPVTTTGASAALRAGGWTSLVRRLALVAAAAAALCAGSAQAAPQAAGDWFWTPGLCKSLLQQHGMELNDGRRFNVANAFCVGLGGSTSCKWSSGRRYRLYNAFVAFVRSYDGTVRMFNLYVAGRSDYRASNIRALGNEPSAAAFRRVIAPIARALAREQHSMGCGA